MIGPFLAIVCALVWSFAVILFKKTSDHAHPLLLNFYKNAVGFALMVPTAFVFDGVPAGITATDVAVLAVSGLFGIGIADAMVLAALKAIGASRMAVVECAYSPFVILMSVAFLGERLSGTQVFGIALVLGALLIVSVDPRALRRGATREKGPALGRGVLLGILGMITMAGGIVIMKPALGTLPLFWIIAIRLAFGAAGSLATLVAVPDRWRQLGTLVRGQDRGLIFLACVLSTYVAMILWVAGFKYNEASVAAVLNQTSTIFTVLFAAWILREKIGPAKIAGSALAIAGVVVIALAA